MGLLELNDLRELLVVQDRVQNQFLFRFVFCGIASWFFLLRVEGLDRFALCEGDLAPQIQLLEQVCVDHAALQVFARLDRRVSRLALQQGLLAEVVARLQVRHVDRLRFSLLQVDLVRQDATALAAELRILDPHRVRVVAGRIILVHPSRGALRHNLPSKRQVREQLDKITDLDKAAWSDKDVCLAHRHDVERVAGVALGEDTLALLERVPLHPLCDNRKIVLLEGPKNRHPLQKLNHAPRHGGETPIVSLQAPAAGTANRIQ
mmetsp:Transcript_19465/g.48767  ORF Transcript_19465/g.48767 Transcript_19465/m.48767 type:complete len:263 (+) Transcript_19465:2671-3459(+)